MKEKSLPHNLDAERSILGVILVENEALHKVVELLRETDFYRDSHRRIFRTMGNMSEHSINIDLITLKNEMEKDGNLDASGGAAYLASLVDGVPRTSNIEYYARIVREKAMRRAVILAADNLIKAAVSSNNGIQEAAKNALKAIGRIDRPDANTRLRSVDLAHAVTNAPPAPPRILSGGWLMQKSTAIIAGDPKVGKSFLALDLAIACARGGTFLGRLKVESGPLRVLYADAENPEPLVWFRLRRMARGAGLSAEEMGGLPLRYLADNNLNLDDPEIRAAFFQEVRTFKPGLIILDSLIRFHRREENSNSEMSAFVSENIAPLTRDYGATVVALHHLGKPGTTRSADDLGHRVRGASDLLAFFETTWTLDRDREGALTMRYNFGRWVANPS